MKKSNQLIVISGGTKGIGRAAVERFASEGFDIVTCARNEEDLETTKREVETKYQVEVSVFKADLGVESDTKAFASFVLAMGREIDLLINNTGIFVPAPIHEEEEGLLEKMINTNLFSAYHLSRAMIPQMKERRNGHIINVCSVASIKAYPTGGSYSISKFAMYGLSKGLREEMKPYGVRVTAILPGATQTSSWDGEDVNEGQLMKPEDIAELMWTAHSLSSRSVVEDIVVRPQLGDI